MDLRNKILSGYFVIITLLVVVGFMGYRNSQHVNTDSDYNKEIPMPGIVDESSDLSIDAGNPFKEIYETIEETYHLVQNISFAAQEITASSQEVVKAIDNVNTIFEQNTAAIQELRAVSPEVNSSIESMPAVPEPNYAAAQEVSAPTQEMTASIQEISLASNKLVSMVENLSKVVSKFIL